MDPSVKAHLAWLALPEGEKQTWRDRAETAIADWRKVVGQTWDGSKEHYSMIFHEHTVSTNWSAANGSEAETK